MNPKEEPGTRQETPKRPGLVQGLGILGIVTACYLVLFPLPVLAADAAGFSLRKKTRIGEALTDPIVFLAEHIPPYKAYLVTSRRLMEILYLPA